jgi:hypothetical protein
MIFFTYLALPFLKVDLALPFLKVDLAQPFPKVGKVEITFVNKYKKKKRIYLLEIE